jgi:hypothetical protein
MEESGCYTAFIFTSKHVYRLDGTIAEILRWGIQFLMASFAYLDIQDKLYLLDDVLSKIISTISIPIIILNFFGGIISGVWLLFLGQWKLVLVAFLFSMVIPWVYSIVALIQMPIEFFFVYAYEKTRNL